MKGLIIYFSGTGTTRLAAEYISSKITNIDFDVYDMSSAKMPNLENYTIVGFATFAQMFYPPKFVEAFIKEIKIKEKKYAFVFNTYGSINGNTLFGLENLVKAAGFTLIGAYALHTPESSPKMIIKGITSEDSPNEGELEEFDNFIKEFDGNIKKILEGKTVNEISLKKHIPTMLLRDLLRSNKYLFERYIKIGEKNIKKDKCIHCGRCEKVCPYHAISMEGKFPKFEEARCDSCFICYNLCPSQAIYSKKYNSAHYSKPNEKITNKLHASFLNLDRKNLE